MHGLNTYDYGARQYNPVTARWDRVDPLAHEYYGVSPYVYCMNNPIMLVDPDGKKPHNWIQRVKQKGDIRDLDLYNNLNKYDNKIINIFAHGYKETTSANSMNLQRKLTVNEYYSVGIQISFSGQDKRTIKASNKNSVKKLADAIERKDNAFKDHSNGHPIIVLHSCATSKFALELSKSDEFKDIVIIAPNANIKIKRGREVVADLYLEDKDKRIKGQWEVYMNGKPLMNNNGKPITYPSTAQPGVKGFKYGF